MNLRTAFILTLMYWMGAQTILCQEEVLSQVADQMELLVAQYIDNSITTTRISTDTAAIQSLFTPGSIDSSQINVEQQERLAEIAFLKSDLGMDLQTSYANNIAGAIIEEDGSFYNWRTQAGVGWDIMRNGWLAHNHEQKEKELTWEAAKCLRQFDLRKQAYRQMYNHIIYAFNQKKIGVITDRLAILNELLEVTRKLYYLHYVHWEDVLSVLSSRSETELFLRNYETYVGAVQLDSGLLIRKFDQLPVFDLVYDKIDLQGPDTTAQFQAMQKQIAALDHKFHWSRDISLNAQLRYSYYVGGPGSSYDQRDFVAGGLTLGIPLSFNQRAKNELKEAKENRIKAEYQDYYDDLNNDVLNHYYEFQYALKQYVSFHYKKEKIAVSIRRSIRKRNLEDPDYNPKRVIDRLDELFSVELELLDIQQKLYLKALKIFDLINAKEVLEFIEIKDFNQFTKQFQGERVALCPERDFAVLNVPYLVEILKYNNISEVMVQLHGNLDLYLKYAALLDAIQSDGLSVRFSLSKDDIRAIALDDLNVAIGMSLTPLVHLDLTELGTSETGDDSLFTKVSQLLEDVSYSFDITATISANLPDSIAVFLKSHLTAINLMPESGSPLPAMYHKVEALKSLGYNDIRVLLKAGNFDSRLEMDQYIAELIRHLEIDQVCIEGIRDLLSQEAREIGWNEERRF